MTTLQVKINEDNAEIQLIKQEIEQVVKALEKLTSQEEEASRKFSIAEQNWNEAAQKLEKLKDAISQQCIDRHVIIATRDKIRQITCEIGDVEQEIEAYVLLGEDTKEQVLRAKAPIDELLSRHRTMVNQMLSKLSRLSITIDPSNLGMSLPSDPQEQLNYIKNTVKPAAQEISDTLNEENLATKQKLREGCQAQSSYQSNFEHLQREVEFLEAQSQRYLEEERMLKEREEKKLYEWRSQAEEQAAKRRARIAELENRASDLRHRIEAMDEEIQSEHVVLVDRASTYQNVLKHFVTLSEQSYPPVTENLIKVLNTVKENQKKEEQMLNKGFEIIKGHPLLSQCLDEVLASKGLKE